MDYTRIKQVILVGPEARDAIFGSEQWCFHDTSSDNAVAIRATSLEPRAPFVIDPEILNAVDSVMGGAKGREIVCLKFAGSAVRGSQNPFACNVRLAIPKVSISNRIGIDWSSTLSQLEIGRVKEGTILKMFVETVKRTKYFVCYDAIASSVLRVCPASNPDSPPAAWPLLKETDDPAKMAAIF